jgi:hypothetical protein
MVAWAVAVLASYHKLFAPLPGQADITLEGQQCHAAASFTASGSRTLRVRRL